MRRRGKEESKMEDASDSSIIHCYNTETKKTYSFFSRVLDGFKCNINSDISEVQEQKN